MKIRVAVLTCTRDRLPYTEHCFASLEDMAGCNYDHYVLDQGSDDGSVEWLDKMWKGDRHHLILCASNIGISRGMNALVDQARHDREFDVILKFDNDCELLTEDTIRDISELCLEEHMILSPHILGLNSPPGSVGSLNGIELKGQIGGIFMAIPAYVFDDYLYPHENPIWGMDDADICRHAQSRGMQVGYVDGYQANHYRTTNGQHEDFPEYFERRVSEGGPP